MITQSEISEKLKSVHQLREKLDAAENDLLEMVNRHQVQRKNYLDRIEHRVRQKEISKPLTLVKAAELLGKSPSTLHRWGASGLKTYWEVWEFLETHKPELLEVFEKNYLTHKSKNRR